MRLGRLVIAASPASSVVDPDAPGVVRWDFADGRAMILAQTVGEECRIWVHRLATYSFPLQRPAGAFECVAAPLPEVESGAVIDGYYRVVLPMLLQAYGFESMHGTAVLAAESWRADAFTLHARPEVGKSTLAAALARLGYRTVADDALIIEVGEPETVRPALRPIPFELRLRDAAAQALGEPAHMRVPDPGVVDEIGTLPLAGCVLIERKGEGDPVSFSRLAQVDAFKRLLEHCYAFDPFRKERTAAMTRAYMRLARDVPVAVFSYPSGLERLPEVAQALAGHLSGGEW